MSFFSFYFADLLLMEILSLQFQPVSLVKKELPIIYCTNNLIKN